MPAQQSTSRSSPLFLSSSPSLVSGGPDFESEDDGGVTPFEEYLSVMERLELARERLLAATTFVTRNEAAVSAATYVVSISVPSTFRRTF
jgi:hypothetical protein